MLETVKSYRKRAKSLAIVIFCVFHMASICWCLLPATSDVENSRIVKLPGDFDTLEQALISFKSQARRFWLSQVMDRYLGLTDMRQSWHLFSPNPILQYEFLTVRVVTGWKENKEPIYDSRPLYQSYRGNLEERVEQFSGSYLRDTNLVQNLVRPENKVGLEAFTQFWEKVYEHRHHQKPLGVHVLLYLVHVPNLYEAQRFPASGEIESKVISFIHNDKANNQNGAADAQER